MYSLSEQNRFYKQAAAFCLRAVAKHSPELAQAVIDSGALDSLVTCLEEFDPGAHASLPAWWWCLPGDGSCLVAVPLCLAPFRRGPRGFGLLLLARAGGCMPALA